MGFFDKNSITGRLLVLLFRPSSGEINPAPLAVILVVISGFSPRIASASVHATLPDMTSKS